MMSNNNNTCDTGLDLSLGMTAKSMAHPRREVTNMVSHEPLLTLGLSDESLGTQKGGVSMEVDDGKPGRLSSPQSAVSSFSAAYHPFVKKEKEHEIDEAERVSSRVSDEDDDSAARKKLRLTREQSALLEDRFKEHSTLNPKQKQALAKQLNLRPRQVEVWFQNRRARTKLKQTEVDCEFLKTCCERLTDENQRLHKELQELKAMKFAAPPVYMQFPAATLSMCPSCERIGGTEDGAKEGSGATGQGAAGPFVVATKPHFYNPFTRSTAC